MYKRTATMKDYEEVMVKEESGAMSKHFYDEHSLYIENNGRSDEDVLKLVDAIVRTHPRFGTMFPEGKPYNRGMVYFSISLHQALPQFRDCTYVFIFDERLYRYIICRDSDTGRIKVRIPLTPEQIADKTAQQLAYMQSAISSWADDTDNEELLDNKYDLISRPYHVAGVTVFDDPMKERAWKRFISDPKDIAIMRGYVKAVKDGLVPNRLIVSNLPSVVVDEQYANVMAGRFATSYKPLGKPVIDKATGKPIPQKPEKYLPTVVYSQNAEEKKTNRARMTIDYDPKTMDASFASILFRNYSFRLPSGEVVALRCQYASISNKRH